jgi:hypothetical protein
MRASFFIFFLEMFMLFFSVSCADDQRHGRQWTNESVSSFLDSAQATKLVAAYQDSEGYTLIIKNDNSEKVAKKLTCISGFPTIVDSLVQTGNQQFESRRFRTTYLVKDSEVVVTLFQKIIHPSSNWQGQTPWQEIIISNYPRLDTKIK